jgi:signal transduction histidine kinase
MTKRWRSIRQALTEHPFRLPFSWWPWRALAYLLTSIPLGIVFLGTSLVFSVTIVGIPFLGLPLANAERYRLRWLDSAPVTSPHGVPAEPGLGSWARFRLRQLATWRELGYAVLFAGLWIADGVIALATAGALLIFGGAPLWLWLLPGGHLDFGSQVEIHAVSQAWWLPLATLVAWPAVAYLVAAYAAARTALVRALLTRPPEHELHRRVSELVRSRARLAGAFEAERRRIERDLHDGAQQRLTSLAMMLGLAKLELDGATPELRELVTTAYVASREALQELRDLVRGIYPPVLVDRGLEEALLQAAERFPLPVDIDIDLPCRPPEAIESTAYFVVCEALTNVAKHSGASRASIHARRAGDLLTIEIRDDGHGGADASHGSGLVGMADRAAVHGGLVGVSSPAGGPTTIQMQIPCAS